MFVVDSKSVFKSFLVRKGLTFAVKNTTASSLQSKSGEESPGCKGRRTL